MSNNGVRTPTADPATQPPPYERQRRITHAPPLKVASVVVGICGLVIVLGGLVWGMATVTSSKADKSQVRALESQVHTIDKDVGIIKTEQRMLIKYLAPRLPVGKE